MRYFLIIFFAAIFTVFTIDSPCAEGDGISLFRDLIRINSHVESIDAGIEQYIEEPGIEAEHFIGRFRAESAGRFRIDYNIPSRQIVLFGGATLYWYYPDDKILYKFGSGDQYANKPRINPLYDFVASFERDYRLIYLGKHLYGFFIPAHRFLLENMKNDLKVDIWIEIKRKVVLAKIIRSGSIEILKEIYSGYKNTGGIDFPSRIDVYARSEKGIIRNTTIYSNIRLNGKFDSGIYYMSFPADTEMRFIGK
jgi:hypothetical protein